MLIDGVNIGTIANYDGRDTVSVDGTTLDGIDTNGVKANTTDELTVGYTTSRETLGSNTITPDIQTPWIKTRTVTGNVTINEAADSEFGGCVILLDIDGSGPYTVTLGAGCNTIGTIPDLVASTKYQATIVKLDNAITTVEIAEIVGA